jgi:tRNA pseudouridine55 synthase
LVVDKPGLAPADDQTLPGDATVLPLAHSRLPTSHDLVQWVRRWSGERQIGHTGTLDPLASGVLVLCLGNATRLVEYYQGHPKQYYAEVLLGAATDTYDALGQPTHRAPIPPLNLASIEDALHQFRGTVLQSPPVFSALKQGGESVHRKARRGESVELTPRSVTFYTIDLLAFAPPARIQLRVCCSAGAYIRSLAHDLGRALQTYGHLALLRRQRAGPFDLDMAHSVVQMEQKAQQGALHELLLPLGYGLQMPTVTVSVELERRLGFGQKVVLAELVQPVESGDSLLACAVNQTGQFLGIVRALGPANGHGTLCKAEKWFAAC